VSPVSQQRDRMEMDRKGAFEVRNILTCSTERAAKFYVRLVTQVSRKEPDIDVEKERSKSKISLAAQGRRSSMSAVTDDTLSGLECLAFSWVGVRVSCEKKQSAPSPRDSSGRKCSTRSF
jgi:hypothetical protein